MIWHDLDNITTTPGNEGGEWVNRLVYVHRSVGSSNLDLVHDNNERKKDIKTF